MPPVNDMAQQKIKNKRHFSTKFGRNRKKILQKNAEKNLLFKLIETFSMSFLCYVKDTTENWKV